MDGATAARPATPPASWSPTTEPTRAHPPIFTFVTDGVASAIKQAKEVAGEKTVGLHGATVMQQALPLGLVDEIRVHVIPVLLGGGTPCSRRWTRRSGSNAPNRSRPPLPCTWDSGSCSSAPPDPRALRCGGATVSGCPNWRPAGCVRRATRRDAETRARWRIAASGRCGWPPSPAGRGFVTYRDLAGGGCRDHRAFGQGGCSPLPAGPEDQ